jgi:(S)-2-hydroxyglutarate dehydrogenase
VHPEPVPHSFPRSVAVIGGGILGLAVGRELTRRFPGVHVLVLEKEDHVAAHQTGHNSGVVHAGLYYPPGSLKATLCRRGVGLLHDFCAEHGIPYRELGKLVVATDESELDGLDGIEKRARANGVPDLARLDAAGMREVEPYVAGVAALHSPHTAVVDFVAVCRALAEEITAAGGEIRLSSPVRAVRETSAGVELLVGGVVHRVDRMVACAGLWSDAVAGMLDVAGDVRIVPFRGEYHALAPAVRDRVRGLIYPVPDPRYPFLGIHLTRGVDDEVLVGPNAVLALGYEGYRWGDVSVRDIRRVLAWPGTVRMARQHWRTGVREVSSSLSRRRFAEAASRYLPGLRPADLRRASAGVRAQAVGRDGRLVDDFVLQDSGAVLLVRNAPSPAATSSLAIAEHVVAHVEADVR